MVDYNGVIYTYVQNYQGDILGVLDNTGAAVVTYSYDAWGRQYKVSGSKADTLGKLNPFRYRGYVYDEETGLYYLRSRYYNPEWGRFISSDALLGKVGAVGTHNLFAYCGNEPVNMSDPDGQFAELISGPANAAAELVTRTLINKICGFEHAFKMGDFSITHLITNITITKDEADSHNSAVSEFVETVSFATGAILSSAGGGTSKIWNKIGESVLAGFVSDKVTGEIQDFFIDAFTVRPGTYTSLSCQYDRTFKYLFFFTGVERHSYELRIYPDYCEVWYSYLHCGFTSTITVPQKVGEMTLFELQEALGG